MSDDQNESQPFMQSFFPASSRSVNTASTYDYSPMVFQMPQQAKSTDGVQQPNSMMPAATIPQHPYQSDMTGQYMSHAAAQFGPSSHVQLPPTYLHSSQGLARPYHPMYMPPAVMEQFMLPGQPHMLVQPSSLEAPADVGMVYPTAAAHPALVDGTWQMHSFGMPKSDLHPGFPADINTKIGLVQYPTSESSATPISGMKISQQSSPVDSSLSATNHSNKQPQTESATDSKPSDGRKGTTGSSSRGLSRYVSSVISHFTSSKEGYRRLINEMDDFLHVVSSNGCLLFCSPCISKLLGHAPEDFVGKPVLNLIHHDDQESFMSYIQQALRDRCEYTIYCRYHSKSNDHVLLEVRGKPYDSQTDEARKDQSPQNLNFIVLSARMHKSKATTFVDNIVDLNMENIRLRKQLEDVLNQRGIDTRTYPLLRELEGSTNSKPMDSFLEDDDMQKEDDDDELGVYTGFSGQSSNQNDGTASTSASSIGLAMSHYPNQLLSQETPKTIEEKSKKRKVSKFFLKARNKSLNSSILCL